MQFNQRLHWALVRAKWNMSDGSLIVTHIIHFAVALNAFMLQESDCGFGLCKAFLIKSPQSKDGLFIFPGQNHSGVSLSSDWTRWSIPMFVWPFHSYHFVICLYTFLTNFSVGQMAQWLGDWVCKKDMWSVFLKSIVRVSSHCILRNVCLKKK